MYDEIYKIIRISGRLTSDQAYELTNEIIEFLNNKDKVKTQEIITVSPESATIQGEVEYDTLSYNRWLLKNGDKVIQAGNLFDEIENVLQSELKIEPGDKLEIKVIKNSYEI